MRSLALVALSLLLCVLSAWAQATQPPALGLHEFSAISVTADTSNNFPDGARVVSRNYTIQNPFPNVLRAIGYRLAVGNTSTSAGVALDVVVGAISTLFDAAIGVGYYGFRAGVAAVGFAEAAWAFVSRFFYIVEWVDTNGNNQLDFNNEVLGGYDLSAVTAAWTPIEYGRIVQNGVGVEYAQTETTDGVFAFRVVGSGGGYVSAAEGGNTVKLNPTTFKVSVSIRYYNNSLNTPRLLLSTGPSSNPNARLALIVGFGAAAAGGGIGVKTNINSAPTDFNGNNLKNVEVSGAGNVAGFSWVSTAAARDVNGVVVTAGAAVGGVLVDDITLPNSTINFQNRFGVAGAYAAFKLAKLGVFTFAETRPTSVVWDPSLSTTDSPAAVLVPTLALLAVALLALFV